MQKEIRLAKACTVEVKGGWYDRRSDDWYEFLPGARHEPNAMASIQIVSRRLRKAGFLIGKKVDVYISNEVITLILRKP